MADCRMCNGKGKLDTCQCTRIIDGLKIREGEEAMVTCPGCQGTGISTGRRVIHDICEDCGLELAPDDPRMQDGFDQLPDIDASPISGFSPRTGGITFSRANSTPRLMFRGDPLKGGILGIKIR